MSYRLLSASKDTYIQNKIIGGKRATKSNVGEAGTLDLYKLYDETILSGSSGLIVELSRILIKFDYGDLTLDQVAHPSFTASLRLKDVYGGQTVPSNYSLVAYPLSKSFDEGRGFDVVAYRDLDTANFESASLGVTWSLSGAGDFGNLGSPDIDFIVSGDIGSGLENLGTFVSFGRGDEDASFNITRIVSASIAGLIPNHGFRISFTEAQEQDGITRFVKRFGSRHAFNTTLHPKLIVEYDADRLVDTSGDPRFGISQSFFTYNQIEGNLLNFNSGGVDITGSLLLELIGSRSVQFITSSFQSNFSASINHLTRSVLFFSATFSGSEVSTGIYSCSFVLDPTTNLSLANFLTSSTETELKGIWKSLDGTTIFANDYFVFKKVFGGFSNVHNKNYVVNAVNLKDEYTKDDEARIRVFVQDRDLSQKATRRPVQEKPVIISDMRWRLIKSYTNEEVIPFSINTKMSTDREGMYFDLFMRDLDINEVYELEFLIRNQTGKDLVIQDKGFIFKVIS